MSQPSPRPTPPRANAASATQATRATQATEGRGMAVTVVLAALLLETVPVCAWLYLLAVANRPPAEVALPPWFVFGAVAVAWALAAQLRRWGIADRALRYGLVGVPWVLAALVAWSISPAITGGASGPDSGGAIGLLLLLAYLWWRGLTLGDQPIVQSRLNRRFVVGLALLVVAAIVAGTLPGDERQQADGLLTLLVPLYAFIGLIGIALAHLLDTINEHHGRRLRTTSSSEGRLPAALTRVWMATSLGLSAVVVLSGFILTTFISYDSVLALLHLLEPLWNAILGVIYWLLAAILYVVFLILNPLISWARQQLSSPPPPPPTPPQPAAHQQGRGIDTSQIPATWFVVERWVVVALVGAVLVFLLVRLLRRFAELRRDQEFEEERESLDASRILRGQLRRLLDGLRRGDEHTTEPLPQGSVRLAYRDVLAAANRASLGRTAHETPDEFARRLRERQPTTDAPILAALDTLTDAYDAARYDAASNDTPASPDAQRARGMLLEWLAARRRGRK